ncbi:MAG: hypothetical protein ACFCGT_08760 [Sandaracinaceae bacterium]
MHALALVLATPLFGLSLDVPTTPGPLLPPGYLAPLPAPLVLDPGPPAESLLEEEGDEGGAAVASDRATLSEEDRERLTQRRLELGRIHRALGIATWASMLVTVTLGIIQFYNKYGFFENQASNPCTSGGAIFGQDQCWGDPWAHRVSWITTTTLYTATFTLSLLLPDPNNLAEARGDYADKLRTHKTLRWVHLGGMIAQLFLGLLVSQNWFGLDRTNNYGALQGIAAAHLGVGLLTFGTLTAAGALMVF